MAALDFPASPTTGQTYPSPPQPNKPVYTFDGEKWTTLGINIEDAGIPVGASVSIPSLDAGAGSAGAEAAWSRGDHVHPLDVSLAPLNSPLFSGNPRAPTPLTADDSVSIATTAFVKGAVTSSAAGVGAVVYNAQQVLTTAEQAQARQNIYASPIDAMAYSGMQTNGSLQIGQELGEGFLINSNAYFCDGWQLFKIGTMAVNVARLSATIYPGHTHSVHAYITTAQPTLTGNDQVAIYQNIEGARSARLRWGTANAQPITVGFWSSHARTGLYSVAAINISNTRACAVTYNHLASGVSQYNVVTIPGCTDGSWPTDNTTGIKIVFTMAAGPSVTMAAPNTWYAVAGIAAPGQANAAAATSDTFRIGGVVVLPGTQAPTAGQSPYIMRYYDDELMSCQRYYWQGAAHQLRGLVLAGTGPATLSMSAPVSFRTAPTLAISGAILIIDGASGSATFSTINANFSTVDSITFNPGSTSGTGFPTAGLPIVVSGGSSTGILKADARLP